MSDLIDDFYTARNLLYLGAFTQALDNLSALPPSASNDVELKSLQYRAHLSLGNKALVLGEIPPTTTNPTLQALRCLALQDATGALQELIKARENLQSPTFVVIAAQALVAAGQTDEALGLLDMHPRSLECTALTTAIYLKMDRLDLAQKLVARVRVWAEDAPIAQLAEAWTALAEGGGQRYNEAYYVFMELAQASAVSTARLYCALAVTKLHLAQYEEAQSLLQSALEVDPDDPDTLANLAVCSSFTQSAEARARYLERLAQVAPSHPFIRDLAQADARFDDALLAVESK
ncbi:hypothetical protein IWW37_000307 [Coemansia sp. RSA 2050]|nr:hypothetical protein IWW37_000307 [Coemansia sp. RSA 2050]KAJ2736735.1 hypothetical protein IW152_000489 [Coemansia sp. BCRC 34962]